MSSRASGENKSVLDPSGTAPTPHTGAAFESRRARRDREAREALESERSAGVAELDEATTAAAPANTEFLSRRERRRAEQRATEDHSEMMPSAPATPAEVQLTRRSRRRTSSPTLQSAVAQSTPADEPEIVAEVEVIEPAEAEVVEPVAGITPDDVPTTTESFEEIIAGAFPVDEASTPDDAHDDDTVDVAVEAEPVPAAAAEDIPTPPRGRHGASESAPVDNPRPPRSIRRLAAKTMSISALLAVGLMTVATSVPANALLSADEVQAQKRQSIQHETYAPGQSQSLVNTASADLALQRDTYGALSVTQAATELGINPENTFTNDPNGTVQWPFSVGVHIGSGYGARPGCSLGCSTNHLGQDFNPGYGAPIQSIADGVVVESTDSGGGFGVKIVIEHVIDGQMIHSLYGHMVPGSRTVQVGDHVSVGQIIGKTGNTGISTGAHMHFEILLNGTKHVDPLAWLYANTN